MVIAMFALGSANNKTVSHKFQATNKRRQLRLYGEHLLFFMKITKAFLWQCGANQNKTSTPMFLLKQAVWHVLRCLSFIPTIPLSASFLALCPTACFILSLAQFLRLPLSFSHHLSLLFEFLQVLCELDADIDHHVLSDQLPLARIVVHLIQDVHKGLVIGEPNEK